MATDPEEFRDRKAQGETVDMLIDPTATYYSKLLRLLGAMLWVTIGWGSPTASAAPKEIIVIRHADKWPQKQPGPTLDPTGYMRAVGFAHYFLDKFGKPDFMVAADPDDQQPYSHSIRELQTLAPLSNLLSKTENTNRSGEILHPYSADQYRELAGFLLTDERFKDKTVLVCWDRFNIPQLTKHLGVEEKIPKWSRRSFDDVYVIRYHENGEVENFTVLKSQYPASQQSWKALGERD